MMLPSADPGNSTLDAASGRSWAREETPGGGTGAEVNDPGGKGGLGREGGRQEDHQASEGVPRLEAGSRWW